MSDTDEDFANFADAEGSHAASKVNVHSSLKRTNSGNVDVDDLAKKTAKLTTDISTKLMAGFSDAFSDKSSDKNDSNLKLEVTKALGMQGSEKLISNLKEDLDFGEEEKEKVDKVEADLLAAKKEAEVAAHSISKDKEAQALKRESEEMLAELRKSEEADELIAASVSLFESVKKSQTGLALINAAGTLVEDRGDDLLALSDKVVSGGVGAFDDLAGATENAVDGKRAANLVKDAESLVRKVAKDKRTKTGVGDALDTGVVVAAKAKELAKYAQDKEKKTWALYVYNFFVVF